MNATTPLRMEIDGKEVVATEGMTVLEAAREAGVSIPTLCDLEKLEPFGGCRLCIVEAEVRGWTRLVVACVYLASEDLIIRIPMVVFFFIFVVINKRQRANIFA